MENASLTVFKCIVLVSLTSGIIGGAVLLCHIIILLMWVVVLFNTSIRLRKKVKYSLLANYNQDTCLEALNSKVEYRKSLFMLAIVLCELISTVFSIVSCTESSIYCISNYLNLFLTPTVLNNSNTSDGIAYLWRISDYNGSQIIYSVLSIPLILTFSLVYTLMSYYVMVTKKSLNYNLSLKSVDLAREQKVLLLVSFVMCLILLVLLVRIEVFVVFGIVESGFVIFQCILTYKYSRKLVQVFKWKIQDTKIAFGTDNYQYKLYNKTLSTFKTFAFFYNFVVIFFSLHVLLYSLSVFERMFGTNEISSLYGLTINIHTSTTYLYILKYLSYIIFFVEKLFLALSLLFLFILNLSTFPYLLSRIHLRCHFNCKCSRSS